MSSSKSARLKRSRSKRRARVVRERRQAIEKVQLQPPEQQQQQEGGRNAS